MESSSKWRRSHLRVDRVIREVRFRLTPLRRTGSRGRSSPGAAGEARRFVLVGSSGSRGIEVIPQCSGDQTPFRAVSCEGVGSRPSQIRDRSDVRHPNQAKDPDRSPGQLDVRVCPTWPLRSFTLRERLALERVVEVDLLLEDDVGATRDFFLNECTSDGRVLLPGLSLIEAFDLGEILNGPNRGVTECELEVSVAILATAVSALTGGVVSPRDDPAVGEELAHRREAFDAVDLEVEREGHNLADPGDPEQTLDVGVGDEFGLKLLLDAMDLVTQQLDLLRVERSLKCGFGREPKGLRHVVLLEQPLDRVLRTGPLLHQVQSRAQQGTERSELGTDHVGPWDQVGSE